MPIYDYKCSKCGKEVQDLRKMTERNEIVTCREEECNGKLEPQVARSVSLIGMDRYGRSA